MPVLKALLDMLAEQRAQEKAAQRYSNPALGSSGPGWMHQEQGFRKNGYNLDPIDPASLQLAQDAGITVPEAILQRNKGIRGRIADDVLQSAGLPRKHNPAAESIAGGSAPEPYEEGVETWDSRAPYYIIPQQGDVTDELVMERRSEGKPGFVASDFDLMNHGEAAALIADQLKARRIKAMGEFSPDYISTLPVY